MAKTTKKQIAKKIGIPALVLGLLLLISTVSAQDLGVILNSQQVDSPEATQEIENLNKEIDERKDKLREVEQKKQELQEQLTILQRGSYSIQNQISAIDNQITDTEYDIQKKTIEIEQRKLEIERLAELIDLKQNEIEQSKERLSSLIRIIDEQDRQSPLYVLFSRDSFSSYLEDIQSAAELQIQVQLEVSELKGAKENLDSQRAEQEEVIQSLQEAKDSLERNEETLSQQRDYQEQLYAQSKEQEEPYEILIKEAEKESGYVNSIINSLEDETRRKILDLNGGLISNKNVPLSWPITAGAKLGLSAASCAAHITCSAVFGYDNFYFEGLYHRGVDVPIQQGTPIYAAADGIIYPISYGGTCRSVSCTSILPIRVTDDEGAPTDMFTVYLHLSSIAVRYDSQDVQFVKKGDRLGYSGGLPGQMGAGFSTGAHLHFGVKMGNTYVNPLNYLP